MLLCRGGVKGFEALDLLVKLHQQQSQQSGDQEGDGRQQSILKEEQVQHALLLVAAPAT